jgi:cysteine desulfurase
MDDPLMNNRIYLDYSATTPPAGEVVVAVQDAFTESFGNASSLHSYGREARAILERGRRQIADSVQADPSEIVFTSGGTEANNWVVKTLAEEGKKSGKNHLISSPTEHHSVLDCCTYLAHRGFDVTWLKVNQYGRIDPDELRRAIRPTTCLITLMHVNNETGSITDIDHVAHTAAGCGVPFHSDAVQSFGKLAIDVSRIPVTALSFSAHKLYGPKGVGGIFLRKGTALDPLFHGGGQERGRRGGTENVPLAVGFGLAASLAEQFRESEYPRMQRLRKRLLEGLRVSIDGIVANTNLEDSLPHILNIAFDPHVVSIDGDILLMNLDMEGLAVSSGSACTSGSMKASHVLLAMGRDEQTSKTAIRFSLGRPTTEDEIDRAVEIVAGTIKKMKMAGAHL